MATLFFLFGFVGLTYVRYRSLKKNGVVFRSPFPLQQKNVRIIFDFENFSRQFHPKVRDLTQCLWAGYKNHPHIFNASKFRLDNWVFHENSGILELHLGITDYSEHLSSNAAEFRIQKWLETLGEDEFGSKNAFMAHALGCETIILTSDEKLLLLRRSNQVSCYPGMLQFGGSGHPEPSNCIWTSDGIRNELFSAAIDEVYNEVNIPKESIECCELIGIVVDHQMARKPDAIFHMRTAFTAEQVRDCYLQGGKESFESDKLVCITIEEMREQWKNNKSDFHLTLPFSHVKLTPVTKSACQLFFK